MTGTRRTLTVDDRAMGSALRVVVVGGETQGSDVTDLGELAGWARRRIADLESRWSRFLPDSDISRLNRAAGQPIAVHPDTVVLVTAMVQAWHATDGAFDPTLLGALVGLGYATSWDDPSRTSSTPVGVGLRGRPDLVGVDVDHHLVELPVGTALDAGGIGKGLAADLVAEGLVARGAAGALVSIGGDLRVVGVAPRATGWSVDVADPSGTRPVLDTVSLIAGAVASSGTDRRRWTRHGADVHHLIDPSTGRPAHRTDRGRTVVGATVVAGTGAWAEAWTKVLMTRPTVDALAALDRHGLAGLVVDDDGTTSTSSMWPTYSNGGRLHGSHLATTPTAPAGTAPATRPDRETIP